MIALFIGISKAVKSRRVFMGAVKVNAGVAIWLFVLLFKIASCQRPPRYYLERKLLYNRVKNKRAGRDQCISIGHKSI